MSEWAAGVVSFRRDARGWRPIPVFSGMTVFCLGSGPRSADFPRSALEGLPTLCTNNEYRSFRAAVIVCADARWMGWHQSALAGRSDVVVTTSRDARRLGDLERVYRMDHQRAAVLPDSPYALAGSDSGSLAVTLAAHLGAARIALIGYDLDMDGDRAWWHEGHPVPPMQSTYRKIAPQHQKRVAALRGRGVRTVALTPTVLRVKRADPARVVDESREEVERWGVLT